MRTVVLVCLLILLTLLTDVHPEEILVRAGDMLALRCPYTRNMGDMETKPTWITPNKMNLTSDSSLLLLHKRSLIFLSVSVNQQGNYSCSVGNSTFWFEVSVYSTLSGDIQKRAQYSTTCYTEESCSLHCPVSNTPGPNVPNMTRNGITWTKDGQQIFKDVLSFSNVEPRDSGVYNCTRSYLYHGQTYNMTFTNILTVKPKEKWTDVRIISPHNSDVFDVDIGSAFVVNCVAVINSEFDEVYWLIENTPVDTDDSSKVFANYTFVKNKDDTNVTASLIFKEVLEKDLSKDYTCKLESVSVPASFVTVTLSQKKHISSLFLILGIVAIILLIVVTALSFIKFKMDISLCHRDRLGWYSKSSDGKTHDAYLMCYKSKSANALSEDDTKWLEVVLEKDFGYDLCLHHRSVPAEENIEETVLQCIQQSRAVILVPTVSNSDPDCGLTALEKHNTRLIRIQTRMEEMSKSSSDVNCSLLRKTEQRTVTWKGKSSRLPSSSFCKELRYHLSPPQRSRGDRVTEIL